jgi:D-3-phosphoglycerate dehydrogenase
MAIKVLARVGLPAETIKEILTKAGVELVFAPLWKEEDIIAHAADADAVIVGATEPYTKKAIQALVKCKILSRMGIGYSNIDVDEATRQGIPVTVVLDASVHEVSDYALACILAFNRKLIPLDRAVKGGAWRVNSGEIMKARGKMFRLNQQTLGLVGMGRIGGLLSGKAMALGMRVIVFDPYLTPEAIRQTGGEPADFETLLAESDYISLHAPLTPQTKQLFGMEEFRKMKPTAYIINAARGALIDEGALHQALIEGLIAGAGLDVTEPEPPAPDNPLLYLDQVVATGHSSFNSDASNLELQQRAAEAVLTALRGEWPPFLINPKVKEQKNCRIP